MSLDLRNELEQCLSRLDTYSSPHGTSPITSPLDSPNPPLLPAFSPGRTSRIRVHTNSHSGSKRYSRDSISAHPKSSGSIRRLSFIPLPSPLQQRSDFHSTFQSFVVPSALECTCRPSSRVGTPNLSRLPRLSQPLFEQKAMDNARIFPPSFSHPNSPYVPLASPVRREFFRPLTPESYVSHFSGFSRSGAIAPEPWEHELYHNATLMKMSNNIRKIRRTVRRKLSKVARRLGTLNRPPIPVEHFSSQETGTYPSRLSLPEAVLPPLPIRVMSNASLDTTHTNSLAQWLNARHQEFMDTLGGECDMTLEDYERIGSWVNFNSGRGALGCGIIGCRFHPDLPPNVLSSPDGDVASDDASDDESSISLALDTSDTTCHSNHLQTVCEPNNSTSLAQSSQQDP
ncbi:hypothetical protein L218DRAFT_993027 [Marasmius fiardii PR-910]|nr:hypothetical protein L218DRAFT_993027 [Marasmius fiardii PR-910]